MVMSKRRRVRRFQTVPWKTTGHPKCKVQHHKDAQWWKVSPPTKPPLRGYIYITATALEVTISPADDQCAGWSAVKTVRQTFSRFVKKKIAEVQGRSLFVVNDMAHRPRRSCDRIEVVSINSISGPLSLSRDRQTERPDQQPLCLFTFSWNETTFFA